MVSPLQEVDGALFLCAFQETEAQEDNTVYPRSQIYRGQQGWT